MMKSHLRDKEEGGKKWLDGNSEMCKWALFVLLIGVRAVGAGKNLIHDCDEVYNYWEPLHYILYGYGKQTWEYSSAFSLRSYLYILVHWVVAFPVKALAGDGQFKIAVFYTVRLVLGAVSGILEFKLVRIMWGISPQTAKYLYVLLLFSTGMFCSSTSFLPSTFAMYTMMAGCVGVLTRNMKVLIISAVLGVVIGWPVAGFAFLPFALFVLTQPNLMRSFALLGTSLVASFGLVSVVDWYFYGKLTVSQWNFVKYNVLGGGQSHLYGVEPWDFYLRNGLLNFNCALLLALGLPLVALIAWCMGLGQLNTSREKRSSDALVVRVIVVCAPLYLWLAAISLPGHKEERFLYVVYPQVCWAAAIALTLLHRICSYIVGKMGSSMIILPVLFLYCTVSVMRTSALVVYYGAPLQVYTHLQPDPSPTNSTNRINVCVGDEWYRFPSSFFLPSPNYRLEFVKQGFSGLLPASFEYDKGTTAAPAMLNDQNLEAESLYLADFQQCSYLIDFEVPGHETLVNRDSEVHWELSFKSSFLENSMSPVFYRALYIPWISVRENYFGSYTLYRQAAQVNGSSLGATT